MFRSLKEIGTAVYRAFLPSHKQNVKAKRLAHLSDHLNSTPTPWGWDSSNSRGKVKPHRREARETAETPVPWGWRGSRNNTQASGSNHFGSNQSDTARLGGMFDKVKNTVGISDSSEDKVKVGWPYRAESFDFAGTKYKYSRKRKTRKSGTAKPWGW